jgi:hypothetical protein
MTIPIFDEKSIAQKHRSVKSVYRKTFKKNAVKTQKPGVF